MHGGPDANAARAALARCRTLLGPAYRTSVQAALRRIYRDASS